ncbi:MAG: efflux RND transporter periplasmic adaptor subunit [Halieaceae bacterium]|nr:efflux RND transporter periplasmic adaptor subunit [Halieaceae bacterium]
MDGIFFRCTFVILGLGLSAGGAAAQGLDQLDCVIQPSREVQLSSAVSGILESIEVDRGDSVTEGQLLARLNSGVERASVELARERAESELQITSEKERLDLATRSLQRIDTLRSNDMISEMEQDETRTTARLAQLDYDTAVEERTIAELEYKRSQEVLKLREITSPLNGYVVDRYKSVGEYVEEQPILTLAQVNPLYVEVIAPVDLYRQIETGMTARVFPEQPIGGELEAVVITVDPVVDAASGTFRVRLELDNSDNQIPAGISCGVAFEGG